MKILEPSERLRRANEIVTEFHTVWGLAAEVALISNGRFSDVFIENSVDIEELQSRVEELAEDNQAFQDVIDEIKNLCRNL